MSAQIQNAKSMSVTSVLIVWAQYVDNHYLEVRMKNKTINQLEGDQLKEAVALALGWKPPRREESEKGYRVGIKGGSGYQMQMVDMADGGGWYLYALYWLKDSDEQAPACDWLWQRPNGDHTQYFSRWAWHIEMKYAWRLVDKLQKTWDFDLKQQIDFWTCYFYNKDHEIRSTGHTAPEAICRAFLKVHKHLKEMNDAKLALLTAQGLEP
jgi:hypothetical protein